MRLAYAPLVFTIMCFVILNSGDARAADQCDALFLKLIDPTAERLNYLEIRNGLLPADRLSESERRFAVSLAATHDLSIDSLYERFSELSRFLSTDLSFAVSKSELLKLSATSLVAKAPLKLIESTIGDTLVRAGATDADGIRRLRRLQTPHSVVLQLAEAKFRLNLSIGEVVSAYNKNLAITRLSEVDAVSPAQLPAAAEAARLTIQELEHTSKID